jgi:lipid II:glycine glycyltransferase (peptidoglycan interpeptide bridge formation enzyme)
MKASLSRDDNACSTGFLQSRFWADFKALAGWTWSRYIVTVEGCGGCPFVLSVMERDLGAGLRFAYIPHGPEISLAGFDGGNLLEAIATQLKPRVSARCVFIRFDPAWYESVPCIQEHAFFGNVPQGGSPQGGSPQGGSPQGGALGLITRPVPSRPVFGKPFVKSTDVQPPDTVVLDLSQTEEELLSGMKPKWRYNIRLAVKKGVTVSAEGTASLDDFHLLYEATAARDRIAIHPRAYYERLFKLEPANPAEPKPDIRLWTARFDGQALAAIITVFYGTQATYLYGASSDGHRNLMPAYALQWAAIRAARDAGCLTYDFYGIPPFDDPNHPMSGLYRFKTGFGGEIRHYSGAWDYVSKPFAYAVFRAAERARQFWYKTIKKRNPA